MSISMRTAALTLAFVAAIGTGFWIQVSPASASSISAKRVSVSMDEARKIALKRVPGEVQDEFTIEDDDGNLTAFMFVIKDSKKKVWEVQIGAEKGDVQSVEQQEPEDDDSGDPPSTVSAFIF